MSGNYKPNLPLYEFASLNGEGLIHEAIGDYSASPTIFSIGPPENEAWLVKRMIVHVEAAISLPVDQYGSIRLTNGIKINGTNDRGDLVDIIKTSPVTHIGHWGAHCYDVNVISVGGAGDHMTARWSFWKDCGSFRLEGKRGGRINIILEDDFSPTGANLLSHEFKFSGEKADTQY